MMDPIKRFDLGRKYQHGVGGSAMVEKPDGAYVRFTDHQVQLDFLRGEVESWRHRAIRAEGLGNDLVRAALAPLEHGKR
ncbi:hypothetical protein RE432_15075 [Pusillimonas sp. SM2304]|uniref:hypothetical protein n=1 Tax=Pusillimonas sp. SM2304 TaxID=3073241 RepID=UPI002876D410|nr:hypothetical protein [Pusillimonas sp. SM2304]MDS1141762.1 hypothetical protein [Pusillimonas sp. SM2304]